MSYVKGLRCRECGRLYPKQPVAGCEDCFAPLEVDYDYDSISSVLSRERITSREKNLWRYRELLPLDTEPAVGRATGATPNINMISQGASEINVTFVIDASEVDRVARSLHNEFFAEVDAEVFA